MGKGGKGGSKAPQAASQPGLYGIEGSLGALSQDYLDYLSSGGLQPMVTMGALTGEDPTLINNQKKDITNEQALAPQLQKEADYANDISQYGFGQVQSQDQKVNQLESGTGLYSSQQAYVDQAVKSGQASVEQQLQSEGLGSSTQKAMLENQVAQSGAATAGQLIQGNIQLAQQGAQIAQQLTVGEQGLSQAATQTLGNLWQSAAQQWGGMQQQGFQQAMEGFGMIGQFLQGAVQPYGYQLQAYNLQLQQELGNAQLAVQEQQAQSSGASSMFGGLGSLLGMGSGGGKGGSGGGILGSLGGLFGGAGAGISTIGGASVGSLAGELAFVGAAAA